MIKKELNYLSKTINSVEYYDSVTVINIGKKKLTKSRNLENNGKLRIYFDDFRFRKENSIENSIKSFFGVPHRLEQISTKDNLKIFNDSKATNSTQLK